jgi:hypothetical protein
MTERISTGLILYGLTLLILGFVGYLSNPQKAKTSLFSGGGMGVLSILLGYFSKLPLVLPISFILIILFSLMLMWRAVITWKLVQAGNKNKLFAASLLSIMLFISLLTLGYLYIAQK